MTTPIVLRKDGRDTMQLRPVSLSVGQIAGAGGSAKFRSGGTCVMALLYGPTTAKATSERYDQAIVQVSIQRTTSTTVAQSTASGVTTTAASTEGAKLLAAQDKKKIQMEDNRIASVIRRILMTTVLDVTKFPRCVVAVTVQVLQDDGSLEACCLNAVMAAVLDSAIPCKLTVAAVSVGTLLNNTQDNNNNNNLILDLTSFEEEQFSPSEQQQSSNNNDDELTDEELKKKRLALKSKGTFVTSFPASSGGVVAVSDLLLLSSSSSNQETNNSAVDESMNVVSSMERAANAASVRLFEIFRSTCCGADVPTATTNNVSAHEGEEEGAVRQD